VPLHDVVVLERLSGADGDTVQRKLRNMTWDLCHPGEKLIDVA
jgi:hypothetical protein